MRAKMRGERPFLLTNFREGHGVEASPRLFGRRGVFSAEGTKHDASEAEPASCGLDIA